VSTGESILDPMMAAVITRLNGDAGAGGFATLASGGAHDAVPQAVEFPYAWVTIREFSRDVSTFGTLGFEVGVWLQVYCRDDLHEGTKLIDRILNRAAFLFHHAALTVTGWSVGYAEYEGATPQPLMEDANSKIVRSKIGRFRFLAHAA
jgi:hypothetical protein